MLAKHKQILNKNTKLTLYKTLILPLFDYGDVLYDCLFQKDTAILQRLQKCAMRSMLNTNRYEHIIDMQNNLGLNPLEVRRN